MAGLSEGYLPGYGAETILLYSCTLGGDMSKKRVEVERMSFVDYEVLCEFITQLQTNDDPNVVVGIVKDHGVYELFYKNYNR